MLKFPLLGTEHFQLQLYMCNVVVQLPEDSRDFPEWCDNVFKHNIDWDDVRFQEMFNLNDIEGFSHERRMLCVDDFLSELQDDELLFLKLNEIAAEALIAVINHHPLFEVTAKEVKPTDRRQAVYLQHEVRRIFQEQVSKEPVNNHLHSV